MKKYTIKGKLEVFPQKGGWFYVSVPRKYTKELMGNTFRGLVPIVAKVGNISWKTSLLPKGDGTHFVAINAKVRKKEDIKIGDKIIVTFSVRASFR